MTNRPELPTGRWSLVPIVRSRQTLNEGASDRDAEARVEEAAGLARAIDLDVVGNHRGAGIELPPGNIVRLRQGRRDRRAHRGREDRSCHHRPCPDPGAAAQPRKGLEGQGHRPHRSDPRDLRRTGADAGGHPPGRTRAPHLSEEPAGAELDPPRTAARRFRLSRRPGRDPDRGRPAGDFRPHRQDQEGTRRRWRPAAACSAGTAGAPDRRSSRWSVTPTPASRRCSML